MALTWNRIFFFWGFVVALIQNIVFWCQRPIIVPDTWNQDFELLEPRGSSILEGCLSTFANPSTGNFPILISCISAISFIFPFWSFLDAWNILEAYIILAHLRSCLGFWGKKLLKNFEDCIWPISMLFSFSCFSFSFSYRDFLFLFGGWGGGGCYAINIHITSAPCPSTKYLTMHLDEIC